MNDNDAARTERETDWTLELTPERGLFDLKLGEIYRYRDLALLLVHRDLVSTYKQTVLGPLWIVIQPLLTTLVFTVIFGNVAGLSTDGAPPLLFYLAGVTCWGYFAECFRLSASVFVDNAELFGKVYFPRLILPFSIVLSNLARFGVQFAVLLVTLLLFRDDPRVDPNLSGLLLVPLLVLILAMISLGFGLVFSALTRTYRDLRHLMQFGVQLLMYATPVIYPLSSLPERYQTLLRLNPLAPVIESFRYVTTGSGELSVPMLCWSAAFGMVVLAGGVVVFNRAEAAFMDTV